MIRKVTILFLLLSVALFAKDRSHEWAKVRESYLREHPQCEVCGISKDLQVHHVKPFSLFPALELDKSNLVTLCTSKYWGINCHLIAGHGGNFQWYNRWILTDIGVLRVYANPQYIKEFGSSDLDNYMKMMRQRTKIFTAELKKEMRPKEEGYAAKGADNP